MTALVAGLCCAVAPGPVAAQPEESRETADDADDSESLGEDDGDGDLEDLEAIDPRELAATATETSPPDDMIRFEDGHTGEMVEIPRAYTESEEWQAPLVEPVEAAPPRDRESLDIIETARPRVWLPEGPACHRYRGRRVCDGPRRVPEPRGTALRRLHDLGLVSEQVGRHLLSEGPVRAWVEAAREAGARRSRTIRFPVRHGVIGRGVGMVRRRGGRGQRLHKGVDIGGRLGVEVLAANDGLVVYANNGVRGYGNLVMIVHADASVTFYAHLQEAHVPAGAYVRRGQVIGQLGSTGLSSGPHLHFEYRVTGQPQDPIPRFRAPPNQMVSRR